MEHLGTVVVWYLVMTAVLVTALAALIFVQHMAWSVRRLRCVVSGRSATQDEATLDHRVRDAA